MVQALGVALRPCWARVTSPSAPPSPCAARRCRGSAGSAPSPTSCRTTTGWASSRARSACAPCCRRWRSRPAWTKPASGTWWRHQLRWLRTIRTVRPLGYALAGVTCGLPVAILGALLAGPGVAILAMVLITAIARLMIDSATSQNPFPLGAAMVGGVQRSARVCPVVLELHRPPRALAAGALPGRPRWHRATNSPLRIAP